jgi:hypothetical protein
MLRVREDNGKFRRSTIMAIEYLEHMRPADVLSGALKALR